MIQTPSGRPRQQARSVVAFLLIGLGCASLLAATVQLTRARITQNRATQETRGILRLTGAEHPPTTGTWRDDAWAACDGTLLLRGAASGYGGDIHWMLAANTGPAGPQVRRLLVTSHQETPGIADFLNDPDHPWLLGFAGHGTDAAEIDAIAGATITTRALARSVGQALGRPLPKPADCPP